MILGLWAESNRNVQRDLGGGRAAGGNQFGNDNGADSTGRRDPIATKANDRVEITKIQFRQKTRLNRPEQWMYVTFKNTGDTPIRSVKAEFVFRDKQMRIIHTERFILFAAIHNQASALKPGRVHNPSDDDGINVLIWDERGNQIFADSVTATVLDASEDADAFAGPNL